MIRIFLILILLFSVFFAKDNSSLKLALNAQENNDMKMAIEYFKKAAEKRDQTALLNLGKIYYDGKYVKRSTKNALQYLTLASKLGNDQAKYNIAVIYSSTRDKKYLDYQKAYDIFYDLALKGHAGAQNRVGMFLASGKGGIVKDYKEAVKWFEESAKQCYLSAECNLASMYANGKGVWQNFGRAHVFAKKGYKKGHPICKKVWNTFNLHKYPKDKAFKFNFFVTPCPE